MKMFICVSTLKAFPTILHVLSHFMSKKAAEVDPKTYIASFLIL